jgi:uncharacterized protein
MGRREHYAPGTFCWADLGVADRDGAKAFYGGLFGWEADDQTGPRGNVYTVLSQDGAAVAGLRDGNPLWISYVSVDDADATLERAREAGAAVVEEPRDVGPAGRLAVLSDPQGATFGLWQAGEFHGAGVVNDEGAMVWQQLSTSDVAAAKDWYGELFGWTWEQLDSDGGWENARNRDGGLAAGLTQLPVPGVTPAWEVSFTVADIPAACRRAEELGGTTIMPPTETPVGDVAVVSDPQGAPMSLFEGETDP